MSGRALANAGLGARWLKHQLRRRPLRHLTVEVTKRCNARCEFCSYWREEPAPELEDYAPVVKHFDPLVVTLSGGEPLLRRDLEEVVRRIRVADRLVHLSLVTNGSLLTVERARALRDAGLDRLALSLDYPDERHDQARGIPGLAARILGLLRPLARLGFDSVSINTVIKDDNLDRIPTILELARDYGVKVGFSAHCHLKADNHDLHVSPENHAALLEAVRLIKEAKRLHRLSPSSDFYLDGVVSYFGGGRLGGCAAGIRWAQVTPDGRVKPCSELPAAEGDYRDYDPRRAKQVDCTACWYSCRGESQAPLTWRRIRELLE